MAEPQTVSFPYLKNMMGMEVDDESMKVIPNAKLELYTHVVCKFEQLGSIMGGVVGAGYSLIRKKPLGMSMLNGARNGWLIGIPIGVLTLNRMMAGIEKKGDVDMDYAYYDRSYRIRNNRGQVVTDRFSCIGQTIGITVGVVKGVGILRGSAAGIALGTISGGIYNNVLKSK